MLIHIFMFGVGQFFTKIAVAFGDKTLGLDGDFFSRRTKRQRCRIRQHILIEQQIFGITENNIGQDIAFGKKHFLERGVSLHLLGKTGITKLKKHIPLPHEVKGLMTHLLVFFFVSYLIIYISANQGNQQDDSHSNSNPFGVFHDLRWRSFALYKSNQQPYDHQNQSWQRP